MDRIVPLCAFSFLAGFVDAIAGGGGLIQLPALMISYPGYAVPVLFGTNKFASLCGTSMATARFLRSVKLDWHIIGPAAGTAFLFSALGSRSVSVLRPEILRPVVLGLLVVAALYVFFVKDIGLEHRPRHGKAHGVWLGVLTGAVLGFYDGFFGPGTGSFLILIFAGFFGFEFLVASASAKIVNWFTNLASVIYFAGTGKVLYAVAVPMALCSILGAVVGAHLAILRGSKFVRLFFLLIVAALIVKLAREIIG